VRRRFPDVSEEKLLRELVRDQIGLMVTDVISTARRNITEAGVETAEEVRVFGRPLVGFSASMAAEERVLKRFMYAALYHHPEQLTAAGRARLIVSELFDAYRDAPMLMPKEWGTACPSSEPGRSRHVADFIAGMTDRYAETRHAEICGGRVEALSRLTPH
jgi:dGTPase